MRTILLALILVPGIITAQPFEEWTQGEAYFCYWYQNNLEGCCINQEQFFSDVNTLLSFSASYGQISPLIFDFNANGTVDSSDLISLLSGYGETPPTNTPDISQVIIIQQFSHGWMAEFQGADICFVKPTLIDEPDIIDPENGPIESFWIELVYGFDVYEFYFIRIN